MAFLSASREMRSKLDALDKSQAVIEFNLDGTIVGANENFLAAVGYRLEEIRGKHHRMFVSPEDRDSAEYRQFWEALARGEFQAAEYKRVGKGGREIWIQASYNPIFGRNGKPYKVVKFAADVTAQKLRTLDYEGQINAISKSQAVIHFNLDGTIIDANENFLATLGYRLDEIRGKHHSMFVEAGERDSAEYRRFWEALGRGEFQAATYKRVGKGGKEVWIQASYNPIFDEDGKPIKVVKFATDISAQVAERLRRESAQASIDADLGAITDAISQTNQQATSAASASMQTSSNVQAVASGAEELAASVKEISQQVAHALEITVAAVNQADKTNSIVSSLAEAAQKIGNVIGLINNIAGQTNLLALNATIEAARAGEAGKGFAVVASEVKTLAAQTSKATDEIGAQIAAVQGSTQEAVAAIASIASTISQINDISSGIAAAVEEQSAVTHDMSANMQSAAQGVDTVTQNMGFIARSTEQVEAAARKVREASRAIA